MENPFPVPFCDLRCGLICINGKAPIHIPHCPCNFRNLPELKQAQAIEEHARKHLDNMTYGKTSDDAIYF